MPAVTDAIIGAIARAGARTEFPSLIEDAERPYFLKTQLREKTYLPRPELRDPSERQSRGFIFPVPGGTFSDSFGAPRVGHTHQGNDIVAVRGTPIYAIADGTVTYGTDTLGGKVFHLYVPGKGYVYGAHLDRYGKSGSNREAFLGSGTRVKQGDIIGYIGNTGNAGATAPHLHFEWHPGDGAVGHTGTSAIDPYEMLNKMKKGFEPLDKPEKGEYRRPKPEEQTPEESATSAAGALRPSAGVDPLSTIFQQQTDPRSALASGISAAYVQPIARVPDKAGRRRMVGMPDGLTVPEQQVWRAFMDKERPKLAKVVGTKEWRAWVNQESGGRPTAVSGQINQGMVNGGMFQFWYGHPWAQEYFTRGNSPRSKFTMSPYEQALALIQYFDIQADEIRGYGRAILSGSGYEGWG